MNILCLYNHNQTYTSTVFEHLSSLYKYSKYRWFFVSYDQDIGFAHIESHFDVVLIHYTIRLPYDEVTDHNAATLKCYRGLKVLFIQDEYDNTNRTRDLIKQLGIQLVFSVVPEKGLSRVYPPAEFPGVRFVSVLTGYVPEDISRAEYGPPSKRQLMVGYRGRHLPIRYGALGKEKVGIGRLVKEYCRANAIPHDIEWKESARIYGTKWYDFLASCRAVLGTESGSNVFDWDGTLDVKTQEYKVSHPNATEDDIYTAVIKPLEIPGLMNQVSPRIFEAIALRTVLVLFEGEYSGVVTPGVHFIPLKKDCSNFDEVFRQLANEPYVDSMTDRAYQDVISSGKYSLQAFIGLVDQEIENASSEFIRPNRESRWTCSPIENIDIPIPITLSPIRAVYQHPGPLRTFAHWVFMFLPVSMRTYLKPKIRALMGKS